jgi:hypothetical protein
MNYEEDNSINSIEAEVPEVFASTVTESAFYQSMMKTEQSAEFITNRRQNLLV